MRINGLNDICYDKGRNTYNFHNENKRVTIKSENILYFTTYLEDNEDE